MKNHYWYKLFPTLLCFVLITFQAQAQSVDALREQQPIQWAFAPLLGTGWYHIDDGRSAFIFRLSPRREVRAASLGESGERQTGFYWSFDSTVGLYDIGDISEIVDRNNIGTIGFTPGIGLVFPASDRWKLKTFANFGWGKVLDEDVRAYIYYGGVKSRYLFDTPPENWAWLTGIYFGGVSPDQAESRDLTSLYTGIEYTQALKRTSPSAKVMDLFWRLGYGYLDDPTENGVNKGASGSLGSTIDLTVALGKRDEPFRLGFLEFERLGLTFSTDTSGEFQAISFVFKSWFEQ